MHIRNDPSFFFMNKTGAPYGDELGRIKPFSDNSCSCLDNSFISDGAKRYGAHATGATPGIRSIQNLTCLGGGSPAHNPSRYTFEPKCKKRSSIENNQKDHKIDPEPPNLSTNNSKGNNTTVTEAQLPALIDQGVAAAMAEVEASRVRNGYNSNGIRLRPKPKLLSECSYSKSLKSNLLELQSTEESSELTSDGLRKWNLCLVLAIAQQLAKSNSQLALCKMMLLHGGMPIMFPEEIDKVEKYIGGLPDMILSSVKASKSKTMQEVIEFTTELMEDKTHAYAERQAERKRKNEKLSRIITTT
ncbi:hypothetical protein Tco_0803741 [Tanacetum coccineum]|uniref:Uncharacterized protein n=1 Tax=Tanacetum coccineum TaxID=301880 RepID=A0ABQ5A6S9_9ASTR